MDALRNYGSSDEEDNVTSIGFPSMNVNTAPETGFDDHTNGSLYTAPTATELTVNVTYDDLMRPTFGPEHPNKQVQVAKKNILTGHVDQEAISETDFRTQYRMYELHGYSRDPSINGLSLNGDVGTGVSGTGYIGNAAKAITTEGTTVSSRTQGERTRKRDIRKKREDRGDPGELEGDNAYKGPWAEYSIDKASAPEVEDEDEEEPIVPVNVNVTTNEDAAVTEPVSKKRRVKSTDTTIFHGENERDYLGRTYMSVPKDLDVNLLGEPGRQHSFIPKNLIHTWDGHKGGVAAIRFLPKSAHLLLSAGMDKKIKIWDVYHDRRLLRTNLGHTKAVKDITFNSDGSRFLSASYDSFVKLWDTETGQCIRTFRGKGSPTPHCLTFFPDGREFLAGYSNKKILHFNVETGNVVQTYDRHQDEIQTVTYIGQRRFVSTSKDKTVLVWERGTNVEHKRIAEADMHTMPAVALDPKGHSLACQSLDNRLLVYEAKDGCRINRKKEFTGHLIAGYACRPGFSPDSRFISSGDSDGNVFVWDWKTCKKLKSFKAHDKVVINTEWHPHESSKMATCSWDGKIKYWD